MTSGLTTSEPLGEAVAVDGKTLRGSKKQGGDYVMIAKDNQRKLKADIELVFTLPPWGDTQASIRKVDIGHGRIESRNLTTSKALVGYSDWPGLAQVFESQSSQSENAVTFGS